jgi:hypothetical protein
MVLETRDDLLHIAYADCAARGRLEGGATCEKEVPGVLKANPFLICEKVAEVTVAVGDLALGSVGPWKCGKGCLPSRKDTLLGQQRYH